MSSDNQFRTNIPSIKGEKDRLTLCYFLYLASFAFGFSAIVGVIVAYATRDSNDADWVKSHYTYLIKTFWLGLGLSVISVIMAALGAVSFENSPPAFILFLTLGTIFGVAAFVLFYARVIIGGLRLYHEKEIENPDTLLI